jgi:hypothetical protein
VSECKNHAEVCWKSQTQEDDESFRDNRQAEEQGWAWQVERRAREIRRWRDGILLRLEQTTGDMAGWGAKKAKPSQMKRRLERIRAEDS